MKTKTSLGEPVIRVSFRTGLLVVWCLMVAAVLVALFVQHLQCARSKRLATNEFTDELASFYSRLFQHEMARCNLHFEAVRGLLTAKTEAVQNAIKLSAGRPDLAALKKTVTADLTAGEDVDIAIITDKLVIADTSYAPEKGLDMSRFPDAVLAAKTVTASGQLRFDYPIIESTREAVRAYTLSPLASRPGWFLQLGYTNTLITEIYRSMACTERVGSIVSDLHLNIAMVHPDTHARQFVDLFGAVPQPAATDIACFEEVARTGGKLVRQCVTADGRRLKDYYLALPAVSRDVYRAMEPLAPAVFLKITMDLTADWERERQSLYLMLVVAVLFLGLSLLAFLWQHRRFLGPLNTVVQAIARSEPVAAVSTVEKNAELATLAHIFNEHLDTMHKEQAVLADAAAQLSREIEGHRATEQKLQAAHDELEHRVTERTAAFHEANTRLQMEITERKLAQERLQQEQRQLRQLAAQLALAEEHERRRIATGLHDDVGQMLALLKIKFACLRPNAGSPEAWASGLRDILAHIDAVIQATRSLTFDLCSPVLQDLGFESALQNLCEHMQSQHHIRFFFNNDSQPKPLPHDFAVLLFRMVRELVLNAVKHAAARSITISLRREGGNLVIAVADDGKGFDTCTTAGFSPAGGFGLMNIRERVRQSGGTLEIISTPGAGASVSLTVPLEAAG